MRKRTISAIVISLLFLFPLICYVCYMSFAGDVMSLATFFETVGLSFVGDNIIFSSLTLIFGSNGILPIFSSVDVFYVATWYIGGFLLYLAVEFLVFIPKLALKWMNKLTKGD